MHFQNLCGQRVLFVALLVGLASSALAQEHTPQNEKNPFAGSAEAATAGEKVYKAACQTCHGGNGTGDRGPALNSGKFPHGSKDGELFLNVRNGLPGTQMPPFAKLSTEQVWHLVTYIRSLTGSNVKANEVVAGDVAAGDKIFYGKANCSGCQIGRAHV